MSLSGSLPLARAACSEATRRMRVGSPRKATDACTRRSHSIMDKSYERVVPPAALSEMLSQPPADEPRTSKVSSRVFTSGFHALQEPQLYRTPPELSRASSPDSRFVERAARARPRTGFADASSGCLSEQTMPRRRETTAKEPRGRSTSTPSERPRRGAARRRNRAKTRTHDDAESHAGPAGGAARRLGLGNVR